MIRACLRVAGEKFEKQGIDKKGLMGSKVRHSLFDKKPGHNAGRPPGRSLHYLAMPQPLAVIFSGRRRQGHSRNDFWDTRLLDKSSFGMGFLGFLGVPWGFWRFFGGSLGLFGGSLGLF